MSRAFEIDMFDNKIKMYFSGLLIFVLVSMFVLIVIYILIQVSILDYETLFRSLLYMLSLFIGMPLYLFFRPKYNLRIDNDKVALIYGKTLQHIMHEFLLSDITNIELVNRFLYEKIVISSLNKHIVIRSCDYKKQDYITLKMWSQKHMKGFCE